MDERGHVDELDRGAGRERTLAVRRSSSGADRKTSTGRSRFPAGGERLGADPRRRARDATRPPARAGARARRGRRRARARREPWRARSRAPPRGVERDDPAGHELPADLPRTRCGPSRRRAPSARGSGERSRGGTRRPSRRGAPCRAAGRRRRTTGGRTDGATPRGCVISRQPSRPPGTSTRASSARPASSSATLRIPKPTVTASKLASSKGSAMTSPSIQRDRIGLAARASSIAGEKSRPVTTPPADCAATARSPVPQHASSTRSPGLTTALDGRAGASAGRGRRS